jgi:glycerol uptake operon antiterminator
MDEGSGLSRRMTMKNRECTPPVRDLLSRPVIPYVIGGAGASGPVLAHASVVFLQGGELADLPALLAPFDQAPLDRVPLMLHLDLVRGLASDEAGLRYVAGLERIDGVFTVHHHLAAVAKRLGLRAIIRLFLQDTRSVERGLAVIEKSKPDAIEILPAVAAVEAAHFFDKLAIPRIAGGLVRTTETVARILQSGCRAVSTSERSLWSMNIRSPEGAA